MISAWSGRARHRIVHLVLLGSILIVFASCAPDEQSYGTSASAQLPTLPTIEEGVSLPPNNQVIIADIYDEALERLGYSVTVASIRSSVDGAYDPGGSHLAIYTVALGPLTPGEYRQGTIDLAALVVPDAFDRWPDLASIDVCQQRAGVDPDDAVTQLTISRAASDQMDWQSTTLEDLEALSASPEGDIELFTHDAP